MKRNFSWILIPMFVLLNACGPEVCEDVVCLNDGTCAAGDCVCAPGYEGFNCEVQQRMAFVGNYAVSEACTQGNFAYTISIDAESENGAELRIQNFGDFNLTVTAMVNGTLLTIPTQTVNSSTISGTGEMTEDALIIDYTLNTTGNQTLECIMTCTPS